MDETHRNKEEYGPRSEQVPGDGETGKPELRRNPVKKQVREEQDDEKKERGGGEENRERKKFPPRSKEGIDKLKKQHRDKIRARMANPAVEERMLRIPGRGRKRHERTPQNNGRAIKHEMPVQAGPGFFPGDDKQERYVDERRNKCR